MRWVFYALLAINLGFFGWHQLVERDTDDVEASDVTPSDTNVARIRMLTEIDEGVDVALEKRSDAAKCDVYGPFFSDPDSKNFLALVKKAGLKGRQEQENVKLKPYYWAYVPPQSSSRKAHALVNRLRGERITAEFIGEGRFRKGVALGNFESMDIVEALQQRLANFDVLVKTEQKSRDYRRFWVLLAPGSEVQIPAKLRGRLIAAYPDIFHQQKVCKPVASG